MKVISIINYKGGVGKTTVTFNLGAELAKAGKNTLLIDFDGQGNLTKFVGVEKEEAIKENIVDVLSEITGGEKVTSNPIFKVASNLDIITCDIRKENWSIRALSALSRETILKRYIDLLKDIYDYDYILIDNAPSVGLDFQNSLVASDEYLIITEPEIASSDGIYTINNVIEQIRNCFNSKLKATGVVINKVQERTNFHKLMNEVIKVSWGDDVYIFKTVIPKAIAIPESEFESLSVGEYAPKSKAAIAFSNLAKELLDEQNIKM